MDSSSSTPTNNTTTTTTTTTTIKTPDIDIETPRHSHPSNSRSISFTNGYLKPHHNHQQPINPNPQQPPLMVVSYTVCLKNHAAAIGGHALDGCGEFMPCPSANPTDPTSLKCAACGCHRNFHRCEPEEPNSGIPNPHHIHQLPPTLPPSFHRRSSPNRSSSPSPISSSPDSPPPVSHLPPPNSYFASPPQMLLALSSGFSGRSDNNNHQSLGKTENLCERKRFRTKFSTEQKEKMYLFAEKLGWRMMRSEEKLVEQFCNEIGVRKGVLKVWMHNNKHTLGKRDRGSQNSNVNGGDSEIHIGDVSRLNLDSRDQTSNGNNHSEGGRTSLNLFSNGSSSSS